MFHPIWQVAALAASLLLLGIGGCSSSSANCNVVNLQREAGRADSDIAVSLGVRRSQVAECAVAPSSEFSNPSPGVQSRNN